MITLDQVRLGKPDLIKEYFEKLGHAHQTHPYEQWAATTIARIWKGFITRRWYNVIRRGIIQWQQVTRGVIARRQVRQKLLLIEQEKQTNFYHAKATIIQKMYRGYRSRTTRMDYYKRKQHLEFLEKNTIQTKRELLQLESAIVSREKELYSAYMTKHAIIDPQKLQNLMMGKRGATADGTAKAAPAPGHHSTPKKVKAAVGKK